MPTLKYCAFENTATDMQICADKIVEMTFDDEKFADLTPEERRGAHKIAEHARRFLAIYDEMN